MSLKYIGYALYVKYKDTDWILVGNFLTKTDASIIERRYKSGICQTKITMVKT